MQPQVVQIHSTLYDFLYAIYPELKFWCSAGGVLWLLFRGVTWIKTIKTNDLHHIHETVSSTKAQLEKQTEVLGTQLEKQTSALVGELRELRADFRALRGCQLNLANLDKLK